MTNINGENCSSRPAMSNYYTVNVPEQTYIYYIQNITTVICFEVTGNITKALHVFFAAFIYICHPHIRLF